MIWRDALERAEQMADEANRLWADTWGELRETDGFQVAACPMVGSTVATTDWEDRTLPFLAAPAPDAEVEVRFVAMLYGGKRTPPVEERLLCRLLARYMRANKRPQ